MYSKPSTWRTGPGLGLYIYIDRDPEGPLVVAGIIDIYI